MNRKKDKKYDERGNLVYYNYPGGVEYWKKYDERNNLIYWKNNLNCECWYKYDENNNYFIITEQEYKEIEFRKKEKEYNSRTKCSRFELIDI